MKYYDILGNELKDGDRVVSVSENTRSLGGGLSIKNFKVESEKQKCKGLSINNITFEYVKVFWEFDEWLDEMHNGNVGNENIDTLLDKYNADVDCFMMGGCF